ncbi:YbdK family carboxylate-amine ligase [Puniceicoccales bacterium CK1056]|uniref:Putative glutamate--cysteine ligase 2 n=1 Tax=Oceanipulchritudo coccoides TaxID=2706888 RepID=A0A6B2M291_9BACT|nr:YbdK family carboxylate-amine ligase [Oceanipulchritudo coccoides]NDV63121.1 YbdK family carboxylate-amine ligase [Oceanipulchritudo coccoides]
MPYSNFTPPFTDDLHPLVFKSNKEPTIGVELELQLVDSESYQLKSAILDLLKHVGEDQTWLKPELMQSYVEINTDVCRNISEARADLSGKLEKLYAAAMANDARILWAGSHPFSAWIDQEITPSERYRNLVDLMQDTARRIVTFGMHVHVGVDSGDKAVMVVDRLMRYMSTMLALSVNSPFWVGRQTGLHSQRIKIMEQLPAAGTPPILRNYSEYCWVVNQSIQSGFINSIQEIWWDVRPHPRFGTVEVRIFDIPQNLEDALALTAMTQCLVAALSDQIDSGVYQHDIHPIVVRQNKWKATRYGMRAELIDPVTHKTIPVREMIFFLYEKLKPYAEKLNCMQELNHIITMVDNASGAERQMELFEKHSGDLRAVVEELAVPR